MLYQIFDDSHYYIVGKKMRPTRLVKGLASMLAADMGQGIYRESSRTMKQVSYFIY
ncbi:hypothetical protein [Streptococcus parasuis]|uniref:hypothetical protein n=1 Tax=Streptococcus parasuis TaxID=1501662 RepID=UPI00370D9BDF